jgi:hypothetical protein
MAQAAAPVGLSTSTKRMSPGPSVIDEGVAELHVTQRIVYQPGLVSMRIQVNGASRPMTIALHDIDERPAVHGIVEIDGRQAGRRRVELFPGGVLVRRGHRHLGGAAAGQQERHSRQQALAHPSSGSSPSGATT